MILSAVLVFCEFLWIAKHLFEINCKYWCDLSMLVTRKGVLKILCYWPVARVCGDFGVLFA